MKKKFFILCLFTAVSFAQVRYFSNNDFAFTSPGAMKFGLYGYDNPAVLSTVNDLSALFMWSDIYGNWNKFNKWGLFTAYNNLGLGVIQEMRGGNIANDYRLSFALGDEEFSLGMLYGWTSGNASFFNRSDLYSLGFIYRPNKYVSVGGTGYFYNIFDDETVFELAVRPLGNHKISVFGDYVVGKSVNNSSTRYSAGISLEAIDGLTLTARYFEDKMLTAGIQLGFGSFGMSYQNSLDKDQNNIQNIYGLRMGGKDRNLIQPYLANNNYYSLSIEGGIKYQSYKFFDDSQTIFSLLNSIKAAKNDSKIQGIVINASGMQMNFEFCWELRDALEEFKSSGKRVVIYFDRTNIVGYYFLSVADYLVLDPLGSITMEGFAMGKNYYKNLLENIGVGFQEWRYLKYKSALEVFSRDSYSDADREQRDRLVEEFYNIVKDAVVSSRNISANEFDRIVNNELFIIPEDASKLKLVDTIARWDEIDKILENFNGNKINRKGSSSLTINNLPNDQMWGSKPEIALIYAIGGTDLYSGMRGKYLSEVIKNIGNNPNVKAIVFRVDSPGGDALAADLVAEALKKFKGKKPIIVSQGGVAASGGYWVSMYADTILASPMTVTGSIGVIGGWYYNKGLKEKIGVSTDYVKRGESADLMIGMNIPLIGVTLPDRAMNEKEEALVKNRVLRMYNEFVNKVALGRNKKAEEIEEIAQGRVWTGRDGKNIGLVDVIGGINHAINIAVEKAGLKMGEYTVVEYPEMPLINFSSFIPSPISSELENSQFIYEIKKRIEFNGQPVLMLPFDDMWNEFMAK